MFINKLSVSSWKGKKKKKITPLFFIMLNHTLNRYNYSQPPYIFSHTMNMSQTTNIVIIIMPLLCISQSYSKLYVMYFHPLYENLDELIEGDGRGHLSCGVVLNVLILQVLYHAHIQPN